MCKLNSLMSHKSAKSLNPTKALVEFCAFVF